MESYDPEVDPHAKTWLKLDEGERIILVEDYHRLAHVRLPNATVHAAVHVTVENQLAMRLPVVVDTFARLRAEGLDRHAAIHAIGFVLVEHLQRQIAAPTADPHAAYDASLQKLSAAQFRDA